MIQKGKRKKRRKLWKLIGLRGSGDIKTKKHQGSIIISM